jgi:hypothetical protein
MCESSKNLFISFYIKQDALIHKENTSERRPLYEQFYNPQL